MTAEQIPEHGPEPHDLTGDTLGGRLNRLRAAVLGANDGIVSTAGLVIGVAAATPSKAAVLTAGLAGLASGAVSMALGEYVSVSTQRDTERALIAQERRELSQTPAAELAELTGIYRSYGLSEQTAAAVARELTAKDPLRAHLRAELGLDAERLANPAQAAAASALSFGLGAALPLATMALAPAGPTRVPLTVVAVLLALLITGAISATAGGSRRRRAILRVVLGGTVAMGITWILGHLFGVATG